DLPALDFRGHAPHGLGERARQIDLIPRADRRRDGARPKREAQMPRMDGVGITENDRTLDAVLQLADVSRPGVILQFLQRSRREVHLLVQIARELVYEVARERGYVAGPLAQRRNADRKYREPEVEVFAELL